jgi:endoglucanase
VRLWSGILVLLLSLLAEWGGTAAADNDRHRPDAHSSSLPRAPQPSSPSCVGSHDGRLPSCTPVVLTRGINITGWFRFQASRDPAVLAAYLSDQALADLRTAGFDFVRLAIDQDVNDTAALIAAIRRIQRHGLTVVVSLHPHDWHLETVGDQLRAFWRSLAPALRSLDSARTVLEIVNEPVFPNDPSGWAALQHAVLSDIRQTLPNNTVVLTGQDWGSIGGLLALAPEDDPNVIYSFHFYDPAELTSLAAYRPGLDRTSLARLPFPVDDQCEATAAAAADRGTQDLMRYYCSLGWDAPHVAAPIERAAAWGRLHHVHVLAGEFGASAALNTAARLTWLRTARQTFGSQGIAWALWGYDDVMGFAVSRPPAPRPVLDQAVLDALGMTTGM